MAEEMADVAGDVQGQPDGPVGLDAGRLRAPRRDAELNRIRLIQAAARVFGEHGTDASVEMVAARAGLGLATLYRRFANKDALIAELIDGLLYHMVETARAERRTAQGLGFERWLTEYGRLQAINRGCLGRLWTPTPESTPYKTELFELLAVLLDDAQAHRRIRRDAQVSDVRLIIYALRGIAESTGYDESGAWPRHLSVVLSGLRPTDDLASAWTPREDP
jgi:AcrR family transcriptional regulator